jgi:hypothetical protein
LFGVMSVGEAEHVAGVLEHHVLESAAGAEERDIAHTGVADRGERTFEAAVWAPGGDPESVEGMRACGPRLATTSVGIHTTSAITPRRPWRSTEAAIAWCVSLSGR